MAADRIALPSGIAADLSCFNRCLAYRTGQQATHCFTQAQDHLRLSYCKARQLLEDSAVTDKSEAAVLLVEAAAGAAARQEDSKLKAAGSSSSLPAITLAGFSEWLELSAGLYNKVLGRPAEAIALYCQVRLGVKCLVHAALLPTGVT